MKIKQTNCANDVASTLWINYEFSYLLDVETYHDHQAITLSGKNSDISVPDM